jgi:hypothetical protein
MTFESTPNPKTTHFIGEWEKIQGPVGQKEQLTRSVKMGNKTYKITVGYDKVALSDMVSGNTMEKVMRESEEQIAHLVESIANERQPLEKVTVLAKLSERTGSVALKRFNEAETEYSLPDLKERNITLHDAAESLIIGLAERCLGSVKKESRLPDEPQVQHEKFEDPVSKKSESPGTIRFVEQRQSHTGSGILAEQPSVPSPLQLHAKKQLETVFGELSRLPDPEPDRNGVKRWERFEIDGVPVQVKEFEEDAYSGPVTEEYKDRQKLLHLAAHHYIAEHSENIRDVGVLSNVLDEITRDFDEQLKKPEYQLDEQEMRNGSEATPHYMVFNENILHLMAQYAKDVQYVINASLKEGEFTVSDLDQCEREAVLQRGRPIVVNIFSHEGKRFVSMQTPESKDTERNPDKTIPSTLRDRPGLANYVSTAFGTVDEAGQVNISYCAIRHSSYSPIAVQDENLRQGIAIANVRQMMTDLAEKMKDTQKETNSEQNPLVIPLRTMMLLTPVVGDQFRNRSKVFSGSWKGESEILQLEESALALKTMRGRVVQLQIGKETVWVKLESSMMNLGANKAAAKVGTFGKIPKSPLEDHINASGYFEFVKDVEQFLLDPTIPYLPNESKELFREINRLENDGQKVQSAAEALQKAISENQDFLTDKYMKLEQLYQQYSEIKDKKIGREIKEVKAQVVSIEKEISNKYRELLNQRKKAVVKHKEKIEGLMEKVAEVLDQRIEEASDFEEKRSLIEFRDLYVNFSQAKQLFESKGYEKPETVMEFQALYIQVQSRLGHIVEFFCKSAEDRTGRVDNKVQEREVFRAVNGFEALPKGKHRDEIDHEISPKVHQYSASRDNTKWNSEAPGLQIDAKVNSGVPADIDRNNATLAKRVITSAKTKMPSARAINIEKSLTKAFVQGIRSQDVEIGDQPPIIEVEH